MWRPPGQLACNLDQTNSVAFFEAALSDCMLLAVVVTTKADYPFV
jgi:hypothetical protein